MKISIITCTYNRHHLLKKNINSVLRQKFKKFEHFVIDDGSIDNTEKIIKNFPHIKYIKLKKNYGQPGAMYYSKVLKKISGDYVILLDSDDYFLKNAKKTILKFINDKKNKNVWSFSFDTKKILRILFRLNHTKILLKKYIMISILGSMKARVLGIFVM